MRIVIPKDSTEAREHACEAISLLGNDFPWVVEIKRHRKTRTLEQIRYWHGVVVAGFCEELGWEHDDAHEYLLGTYFGWYETMLNDRCISRPVQTFTTPKAIKRDELSRLIDWAIAFAAKQGILIPGPNEVIL